MCTTKTRRREGFSLILVLIIFLIGVSVSGGVMYMVSTYAGGERSSIMTEAGYNVMQDGLEQGKTILRERLGALGSGDLPPRWTDVKGASYKLKNMEDLLIADGKVIDGRAVSAKELGGRGGRLSVKIYDLQYLPADLDPALSNDVTALMKMPPSMNLSVRSDAGGLATIDQGDASRVGSATVNVGVYLISSSLTVGGDEKSLESVVVQSKR